MFGKVNNIGQAMSLDVQQAGWHEMVDAWRIIGQRKLEIRQTEPDARHRHFQMKYLDQQLDRILYELDPYLKPWELNPAGGSI